MKLRGHKGTEHTKSVKTEPQEMASVLKIPLQNGVWYNSTTNSTPSVKRGIKTLLIPPA